MKRLLAIVTAVATVLGLAGCGGGDDQALEEGSDGKVTLKVGVLPIANLAPFYVAVNEGFFDDQGLKVEPVVQQGGAEVVASLVSGALDVGWSATTGTVITAAQGPPIKVVAPGTIGPTKENLDETFTTPSSCRRTAP